MHIIIHLKNVLCHSGWVPGKSLNAGGGWAPKLECNKGKIADCKLYKKFWCLQIKMVSVKNFLLMKKQESKPGYFFSYGNPPQRTCFLFDRFELF